MLLRFYACGNTLVSVPGPRFVGQVPRYVGRKFQPAADGKPTSHPATEKPYEVDSASNEGRRLSLVCRRDGSLYAADVETAKACGVDLLDVSFADGTWSAKAKAAAEPAKAPAKPQKPAVPAKPAAEPVKEPKTNG
jgi:hypothetical protein